MEGNKLVIPKLAEIKRSRIVVTTLITSRILFLKGLESGHFSHIIIDEAAQVQFGHIICVHLLQCVKLRFDALLTT